MDQKFFSAWHSKLGPGLLSAGMDIFNLVNAWFGAILIVRVEYFYLWMLIFGHESKTSARETFVVGFWRTHVTCVVCVPL